MYFHIFVILLFLISPASFANDTLKNDVIIIGAGVAGLAAAQALNKHGMHVLVLEARNRVGGRIHTIQPWGAYTDLGASWIHQINNNPLSDIVKKNNLPVTTTSYSHENPFASLESAIIYDANGKKMDKARFNMALAQVKKFKTYLDTHTKTYNENVSVADALQEYIKKNPLDEDSLNLLIHISGDAGEYENGANIATTSPKVAYGIQSSTNGRDVIFKYGYTQLLAQLTKHVPILLNEIVTKVKYTRDGVTVYTINHQYTAKYVISTLPLGVLKAGTVKFNPALPAEKLGAIKRMGVGVYNKAYLLFDKPFWDKKNEWIILLQKKITPNEDFEILNYYPISQQPILLAFTTGTFASTLETETDKQIVDRIMETLKLAYGQQIPAPTSYLITHWGTDPFARGSFTYPRVGSSLNDYKLLAKPVQNRVFFAGEATSWTDPSTVTGAYLSGVRAANEIVNTIY